MGPASTLAEAYALMAAAYPPNSPPVWEDQMHFSFYAGAMALYGCIQKAGRDQAKMRALLGELIADSQSRAEAFDATKQ